jgi:hypothetical protein
MSGEQLNKFGPIETVDPSAPTPALKHCRWRQVSTSAAIRDNNPIRRIADFFGRRLWLMQIPKNAKQNSVIKVRIRQRIAVKVQCYRFCVERLQVAANKRGPTPFTSSLNTPLPTPISRTETLSGTSDAAYLARSLHSGL